METSFSVLPYFADFFSRKPTLVAQITRSNNMNIDGRMKITTIILMIAPRAIKEHRELIISMFEYIPTPKVAAKKLSALTIMD